MNQLMIKDDGDFLPNPKNMKEAIDLANVLIESGFAPPSYKKPAQIIVAIQYGKELGLKPIHALHSIAIINGRPATYGDGLLAICRNSPEFEDMQEKKEEGKAICIVKRKGQSAVTREFSIDDAKKAGLLGKTGPWSTYPDRMLQMRARSWALRDAFADVLQGLIQAEEAQDIPDNNKQNYYNQQQVLTKQNETQKTEFIFDLEAKLQAIEQAKSFDEVRRIGTSYYNEARGNLPPAEANNAMAKIKSKVEELKNKFGELSHDDTAAVQNS